MVLINYNYEITGITLWNNVDISISISKGSTFSIDPNDKKQEISKYMELLAV
jgi:hypothetical protein